MKRTLVGLVGAVVAGLLIVGCSSGDQVSDKGAMDKYDEIKKQTEASEGQAPLTVKEGQGD